MGALRVMLELLVFSNRTASNAVGKAAPPEPPEVYDQSDTLPPVEEVAATQ